MEHTQAVQHVNLSGWPSQLGDQPDAPPAQTVAGDIVTRITLPSGGWAEIRDAKTIRAKHRKKVIDQLNMDRLQASKPGLAFDMVDGLIIMMVEKWHIPYLPDCARPLDDVTSVDELTIPDYDALSTALEPAREVIFPSPATVDGAGTPGSPTQPDGG